MLYVSQTAALTTATPATKIGRRYRIRRSKSKREGNSEIERCRMYTYYRLYMKLCANIEEKNLCDCTTTWAIVAGTRWMLKMISLECWSARTRIPPHTYNVHTIAIHQPILYASKAGNIPSLFHSFILLIFFYCGWSSLIINIANKMSIHVISLNRFNINVSTESVFNIASESKH